MNYFECQIIGSIQLPDIVGGDFLHKADDHFRLKGLGGEVVSSAGDGGLHAGLLGEQLAQLAYIRVLTSHELNLLPASQKGWKSDFDQQF